MFKRNNLTELREMLTRFVGASDSFVDAYEIEISRINKNYKDELIKAETEKIRDRYIPKMADIMKASIPCRKSIIERMKKEIDEWATSPIPQDVMDKLNAVEKYGIELTREDFESLYDSAKNNYMASKVVVAAAEKQGVLLNQMPNIREFKQKIDALDGVSESIMQGYCRNRDLIPAFLNGKTNIFKDSFTFNSHGNECALTESGYIAKIEKFFENRLPME